MGELWVELFRLDFRLDAICLWCTVVQVSTGCPARRRSLDGQRSAHREIDHARAPQAEPPFAALLGRSSGHMWCGGGHYAGHCVRAVGLDGCVDRGVVMDPVTLVLAALVAGAAKGVGSAAESAVGDAYRNLKGLLGRLLRGRQAAEVALQEHESNPAVWKAPLETELRAVGVDSDAAVLEAARQVVKAADPAGFAAGKYSIVASGAGAIAGHTISGPVATSGGIAVGGNLKGGIGRK